MQGKNERASLDMFLEVENMDSTVSLPSLLAARPHPVGKAGGMMSKSRGVVCCERRDAGMQWLGWETLGARESVLVCAVAAH